MAREAESPELKQAFQTHRDETEGQVERLNQVFEQLGRPARGKTCEAIVGIIDEAEETHGGVEGRRGPRRRSRRIRAGRRTL